MIDESTLNRIENVLDMYGFKIRVDLPEKEVVYGYMQKDKKKIAGKLKFVDPECEVVSSAKKMGITFGE